MHRLSLLSGFMGATASCLAKFALGAESPLGQVNDHCLNHLSSRVLVCTIIEWIPRLMCLISMIVLNATMMGYFLQGMEESGSVAGTGLATAANFLLSAVFGVVLWHENVSGTWLCGFGCVLGGVLLLSGVKAVADKKKDY